MKHILNNAAQGTELPWVTYKDKKIYYPHYVKVTYNITDISGPSPILLRTSEFPVFERMLVDGKDYDCTKLSVGNNMFTYQFTSTGEHIIKFLFGGEQLGNDAPIFYNELPSKIIIPNNCTTIGNHSFNNCTKLTSITIPNSVISIGSQAFYNCNSLTTVIIPSSIIGIGSQAFAGCASLSSIEIPSRVVSIGS